MPGFHSSQEMFDLEDAVIVTVTPRALLVRTDEDEEPVWVPRSQIENVSREGKTVEPEADEERTVDVRMTAWIAKQKGFI